MDQRRIRPLENEVITLTRSLEAAQFILNQWKDNQERGLEPAIPEPSITSMKGFVRGMRRNLDNIDEILDSTED